MPRAKRTGFSATDLTTAEAAEILQIEVDTVAALCRRPRKDTGEPSLRAYYDERLRRWMIPRAAVEAYRRANTGPGRPRRLDGLDAILSDRAAAS